MKTIIISTLLLLISTITFAQNLEGTWTATIDTQDGPFTFYAEFNVEGDTLTGRLYSDYGSVNIYNSKIDGNEFEYNFDIDYTKYKQEGKLVNGELKIKSISDNGELEVTMTPVKKE
jgi:hypothetical protein